MLFLPIKTFIESIRLFTSVSVYLFLLLFPPSISLASFGSLPSLSVSLPSSSPSLSFSSVSLFLSISTLLSLSTYPALSLSLPSFYQIFCSRRSPHYLVTADRAGWMSDNKPNSLLKHIIPPHAMDKSFLLFFSFFFLSLTFSRRFQSFHKVG